MIGLHLYLQKVLFDAERTELASSAIKNKNTKRMYYKNSKELRTQAPNTSKWVSERIKPDDTYFLQLQQNKYNRI